MSSDRQSLLEMGFTEVQVNKALAATGNSGLTPAQVVLLPSLYRARPLPTLTLDYIDKHADKPQQFWDEPAGQDGSANATNEPASAADAEAKSLKCLECGKLFKNAALANYHGEKSGHENFEETTEEIAPLTEEQKAAKLEELKAKMAEKKKAQAKKDAEEAKRNEEIRRKGGKEQQEALARLQVKEAEKEAAQRKAEKLADLKARAAVRAQIEADKKARADKAAREKALREGVPLSGDSSPSSAQSKPLAATSSSISSSAQTTRLQIRLPSGGQPLNHTVPSTSTLADVKSWVGEKTGLGSGFAFSSVFPRKTYSAADESKTMTELGLAPSASPLR
ncbi:hypothetical protein OIV83_003831 [Microbotryomycetes sp. JL201]|nr:hypothetical protein OIV83_003831 [Microbotryomycetes sp. JL201]